MSNNFNPEDAERAIMDSRMSSINEELALLLKDKGAVRATKDMLHGLTGFVKEAASVGNVFSSFKDTIMQAGQDIGANLTEGLEIGLGDLVDRFDPLFTAISTGIGNMLTQISLGLEPLFDHLDTPIAPEGVDPLPMRPGVNPTIFDLVAQGALSAMLGMPLGLINLFAYLTSPGGGLFG